jgi:hypothetical protein
LGLSRNKVAVPEGVAGTPPFWRVIFIFFFLSTSKDIDLLSYDIAFVSMYQGNT